MTRRHRSHLLAGAACLAVVTACSSAPAPTSLSQNGGTTGASQPAGSSTGTVAGGTSATTGGAVVPGAAGGTGGGTSGGTTGGSSSTSGGSGTGGATSSGGATGGGSSSTGGGSSTGGTPTVINTGRFPHSTLFHPDEETIGLTSNSLTMCAHAALTYGQAFGTKDTDFNVFWDALNKEHGGVNGRQVHVTYENDDYKPTTAVQAATACKAKGIFMLLGGIGFDQIPAVRNWAETNRMLYVHHTATVNGTSGQQFSFSELPSVERTGQAFAQLAALKFKGKRIGIIERDSANWTPGVKAFYAYAKTHGLNIVADTKVANNKGSYADDLLAMQNAHADVVWGWVNALEGTELIKQAKSAQYSPNWLLFPFNLTSQTLDTDALQPKLDGVAMYPAYSYRDYSGKFSTYADDMKEFERQYAQYDSGIDLKGIGGDLLFLNWVAQKALAVQLQQCGRDCTRDRFIDVLHSYHGQTPTHTACPIDFSGNGHLGSDSLNFLETYASPSGKVNWHDTALCVRP